MQCYFSERTVLDILVCATLFPRQQMYNKPPFPLKLFCIGVIALEPSSPCVALHCVAFRSGVAFAFGSVLFSFSVGRFAATPL